MAARSRLPRTALAVILGVALYAVLRHRPEAEAPSEQALISAAQDALADGNVPRARTALSEHARRFPHGQLTTQRKLLEVYADRAEHGGQ